MTLAISSDSPRWVDAYRPKSFDEFIFQDDATALHIMKFVGEREIPHLLLSGPPGTGKTSCAFLLLEALDISAMDTLVINASKENNVAMIRDRVTQFCSVAPWDSTYKVVLLEEGDFLTDEAQGAMRRLMEENVSSVRFILTCNYPRKIVPALLSRMAHFQFTALPPEKIVERVVTILDQRGIKWEIEDVNRIIESAPTDLRKIIQMLDQYSTAGHLILPSYMAVDQALIDTIQEHVKESQWDQLRAFVGTTVPDSAVPNLFRMLYDSLNLNTKFAQDRAAWEQAVVAIADYMHRSTNVADQFINFAALTIELKRI